MFDLYLRKLMQSTLTDINYDHNNFHSFKQHNTFKKKTLK